MAGGNSLICTSGFVGFGTLSILSYLAGNINCIILLVFVFPLSITTGAVISIFSVLLFSIATGAVMAIDSRASFSGVPKTPIYLANLGKALLPLSLSLLFNVSTAIRF